MSPFMSVGWWIGWAIGVSIAIVASLNFDTGLWGATALGFLLTLIGSQVGLAIQLHRRNKGAIA